jgi:hypothetical protein
LPLTIGTRPIGLRCTAPSTVALLEVREMTPLGIDPVQATRRLAARLWVVNGVVEISDPAGGQAEIAAGERWGFLGDEPAEVIPEIPPDGVAVSSVRDIDRQAQEFLAPQLATDEPLVAALRAAYRDRRTDVRSLAARSLASMDVFEPLVETFSDPRYHASWTAHFDTLRAAIQRSPESAKAVRTALQTSAGPNAEMLYRMLWGFTTKQLEDGAASKLVDALEHRDLPVRVIAGETLQSITQASAGYRADYHLNRRRDAIQIWRRKLREGAIRYLIQPENDGP